MKWLIGAMALLSAVCECYGTATVWRSYKLTSQTAQRIYDVLEKQQSADDEEMSDLRSRIGMKMVLPEEDHRRRTLLQTAILTSVSPLLPNRQSVYGLLAYIFGAIFGLAAALLALVVH